jgi:hypothetical protein
VRTPISPFPQRIRGRGRSSIRNLLIVTDLPHSAPLPALCLSPACLQFVKSATVVSATMLPLEAVRIRIFHSNRALLSQFRGSFPCRPSPCAKQRRRTPPQNHRPGRQADQGFLADGGIKPTPSVDVSPGLELHKKKEKRPLRLPRLPGDVEDLITGSTLSRLVASSPATPSASPEANPPASLPSSDRLGRCARIHMGKRDSPARRRDQL